MSMPATSKTNAPAQDYFAIFGLPRKLWMERDALEQKYLQLSWKLHPDNFVNATEEERERSLRRSSELNDAYRTLKDSIHRTEYLLKLHGAEIGEEHSGKDRRKGEMGASRAPADLLEEVFDLNMQLEEMRMARASGEDDPALAKSLSDAKAKFEGLQAEVDDELRAQWTAWDNGNDAARQAAQKTMVALLDRRRYLSSLVREVNETMGAI